jgi:hypothetical protein
VIWSLLLTALGWLLFVVVALLVLGVLGACIAVVVSTVTFIRTNLRTGTRSTPILHGKDKP